MFEKLKQKLKRVAERVSQKIAPQAPPEAPPEVPPETQPKAPPEAPPEAPSKALPKVPPPGKPRKGLMRLVKRIRILILADANDQVGIDDTTAHVAIEHERDSPEHPALGKPGSIAQDIANSLCGSFVVSHSISSSVCGRRGTGPAVRGGHPPAYAGRITRANQQRPSGPRHSAV